MSCYRDEANKKLQPTFHAVSICMNTRSSYFIMQTAPACNAAELGVKVKRRHSGQ